MVTFEDPHGEKQRDDAPVAKHKAGDGYVGGGRINSDYKIFQLGIHKNSMTTWTHFLLDLTLGTDINWDDLVWSKMT